jgi:hypothetical protein
MKYMKRAQIYKEPTEELIEAFKATLEKIIVCPYCGKHNQLDPPLLCCGEVHAEEAWEDEDGEIYLEADLLSAATDWKKEQEQ